MAEPAPAVVVPPQNLSSCRKHPGTASRPKPPSRSLKFSCPTPVVMKFRAACRAVQTSRIPSLPAIAGIRIPCTAGPGANRCAHLQGWHQRRCGHAQVGDRAGCAGSGTGRTSASGVYRPGSSVGQSHRDAAQVRGPIRNPRPPHRLHACPGASPCRRWYPSNCLDQEMVPAELPRSVAVP